MHTQQPIHSTSKVFRACIYIYTYVYIYICIYMCICIYMYVHTGGVFNLVSDLFIDFRIVPRVVSSK